MNETATDAEVEALIAMLEYRCRKSNGDQVILDEGDALNVLSRLTSDAHQISSLREEARAATERAEKAGADKSRLDFLDACNAALNARYGTNYGWSLVLTHNVTRLMLGRNMEVDLHDSEGGNTKLPSCRGAIDREMSRIDVERRARAREAAALAKEGK